MEALIKFGSSVYIIFLFVDRVRTRTTVSYVTSKRIDEQV